ncbi:FxLYD domain-containing protein [Bacillus sp. FJAT-27264]|uniref:FxLYD domain-containing protein n=1 Tax=Paenibacillus sp. (strain DSM 101736 / FJAT-27264) TaxID=1850362 RepID=UPI000B168C98|nr:FxLYD domain-containing protein [Bacillus sp. FJAT-27264]
MFCHQCGAKNASDQKICENCGARLLTKEMRLAVLEMAADTELLRQPNTSAGKQEEIALQGTSTSTPKKGSSRVFQWVIPLLLAGVIGTGLMLYYNHELSVNQEVMALQQHGKKEALAGRYSDAVQLLEQAIEKRPSYAALTRDRELAVKAAQIKTRLDIVPNQLKSQKLNEGEKSLKDIANMIGKREEPLFAPLQKGLAEQQTMLKVLRIKGELDKLSTISALADKLDSIRSLNGQEAAAVKAQIINKITGISYSSAEAKLRKKDFAGALAEVDNGLFYNSDNEKLTAYRKQITEAKREFEKAQTKRIQLAEQKAAEEDLKNRTAAVNVSDLQVILDDYGDLSITGTVTNTATRPIYSISLNLEIYSSYSGSYIGSTYADVSPYKLNPGESGSFSTSYYGVYQQVQVSAANASWYLE